MKKSFNSHHKIIAFIQIAFMLLGGLYLFGSSAAQKRNKSQNILKVDSYHRPKPNHPIKPVIPAANRFQSKKVFLEYADSLYKEYPKYSYTIEDSLDNEKQIVKGSVKFRHGGMWMYCDSAYYYPSQNKLSAFGHVEMKQGDTLFVYADHLKYDGQSRRATLINGPSNSRVKLKHRKTILETDSLDYDMNQDLGWYNVGGKLYDDVNSLTSGYGEYSPATKIARFSQDVVMVNSKDDFKMTTEDLVYNTVTHIADINSAAKIVGKNDTIITNSGKYDTTNDNAWLTSRSKIIHKDSLNNVITLEGDSIIYDKIHKISRAFSYRDLLNKDPKTVVLTDTARKVILIGGYAEYNDSAKRALATDYPLLIEYSRQDTLFLRADTVESLVRTELVWPDSLSHNWNYFTRLRLRSFGSLIEIADSMPVILALLPSKLARPGDNNIEILKLSSSNFIENLFSPESRRESRLVDESNHSSKKSSLLSASFDTKGEKSKNSPEESISKLEKDTLINSIKRLDILGRDSSFMVLKDYRIAKAKGRARFFNQQIQGIADTLIYEEFDSTLYMLRKPIVWSGERQIYGKRIDVHFNDTTVDRAYLPESGVLSEHVDEDFYNQLSGKNMVAIFKNKFLEHLDVKGSVAAIFLPMENDSTYNRLVSAESSTLSIDMGEKQMNKLKMWPEVTGSVIPLFLVKKSQQFLPNFQWYDFLRPKRAWYGNRWIWIDDLGEINDALEQYFKSSEE